MKTCKRLRSGACAPPLSSDTRRAIEREGKKRKPENVGDFKFVRKLSNIAVFRSDEGQVVATVGSKTSTRDYRTAASIIRLGNGTLTDIIGGKGAKTIHRQLSKSGNSDIRYLNTQTVEPQLDEQSQYSVLSQASYDFFRQGAAFANSELRDYGLDYTIDPELSDASAVVLTRPNGEAVVSYRGTDHVTDLVPDLQIAMGYHSSPIYHTVGEAAAILMKDRFADARDRYEKAKHKYGAVSVTGHSLGGALALHAARAHGGAKAVVFNPGSSPLGEPFHAAYCATVGCDYTEKARIYTTGRDPISISSYIFDQSTDDVIKVEPKDGGDFLSHGLEHFLPPKLTALNRVVYVGEQESTEEMRANFNRYDSMFDLFNQSHAAHDLDAAEIRQHEKDYAESGLAAGGPN